MRRKKLLTARVQTNEVRKKSDGACWKVQNIVVERLWRDQSCYWLDGRSWSLEPGRLFEQLNLGVCAEQSLRRGANEISPVFVEDFDKSVDLIVPVSNLQRASS